MQVEKTVWWRQSLKCCSYKSRNTKVCQQTPKLERRSKKQFSHRFQREHWPCWQVYFGLQASRTETTINFCNLYHQICTTYFVTTTALETNTIKLDAITMNTGFSQLRIQNNKHLSTFRKSYSLLLVCCDT